MKPTATAVLSAISGLSQRDVRSIAAEVQANHEKLNKCPLHDFVIVPEKSKPLRSVYRCKQCGGEIDGQRFSWWQRGQADARTAINFSLTH